MLRSSHPWQAFTCSLMGAVDLPMLSPGHCEAPQRNFPEGTGPFCALCRVRCNPAQPASAAGLGPLPRPQQEEQEAHSKTGMQLSPLPMKKCQRGTKTGGGNDLRALRYRKSRLKRRKAGQGQGAEGDKDMASKPPQNRARHNVQRGVESLGHQSWPKLCGPRQGGMRWEGRGQQRLNCNLMACKITGD